MTLSPSPHESQAQNAQNAQNGAETESETETAYQLLGRAIAAACDDPSESTVGLHALIVYAVEHARLEGVSFIDLMRALDGWIDLHTQGRDEQSRWRVATTVRHWALAEYLACEARATEACATGEHSTGPDHDGSSTPPSPTPR